MPNHDSTPAVRPTADPLDRLNGWKDIANFLGKGVRTAQRWERDLGLPIHRLGKDAGEIVFAFKSEITTWLATADRSRLATQSDTGTDGPQGPPPRPAVAPRTVGTRVAPPSPGSGPHSAPAFDQPTPRPRPHSRQLPATLRAALPRLAAAAALAAIVATAIWMAIDRVAPMDVTTFEAAAIQPTRWRVEDNRLKVLDERDALLWDHLFPSGIRATDYPATHRTDAGVIIDDLDGDGTREVIFVQRSATRSERRLHVFNHDGTRRALMQPTPSVTFGDTAYGPPWLAHYTTVTRDGNGKADLWASFIHGLWFPTLLQRLDQRGHVVSEYWSNGYVTYVGTETWRGRPVVLVVNGSAPLASEVVVPGAIYYTLDHDLVPTRADLTREFREAHSRLERDGLLDHAFGDDDIDRLFPVRKWDETRFVALPRPAVVR